MPLLTSVHGIEAEQPGFLERISYICKRMEELDPGTVEAFADRLENAEPGERPGIISTLLQLAETDLEQRRDEDE